MELKIEYIKAGELKAYANNAKLHPAEQVEQIKNSIEQFGFNDPIAVWKDNEIIEGHGRLLAALEIGGDDYKVPIVRLDDLTDKQRKAYMIAHNKLSTTSGFDNDLLKLEIEDIVDDFDMTDFGFGDFELTMLMEDFEPEPYDKEMVEKYSGNESDYLEKKRIIITYKDEDEEAVKAGLGLENITKVVYDAKELWQE